MLKKVFRSKLKNAKRILLGLKNQFLGPKSQKKQVLGLKNQVIGVKSQKIIVMRVFSNIRGKKWSSKKKVSKKIWG